MVSATLSDGHWSRRFYPLAVISGSVILLGYCEVADTSIQRFLQTECEVEASLLRLIEGVLFWG